MSTDAPAVVDRYDEVPYPSAPYRGTHPALLAALASLFGVEAPDPRTARVLELGCASGGNLAPMAEDLPDAHFVGLDLSARQVATGQAFLAPLGLSNLELRHQSILDFAAEPHSFDYIVCHGVYSWVPPAVQDKILAIAAHCLSPRGVLYVSYNCYPGWYLRGIVRDMMRWHAASFDTPADQVRQSRELLKFLVNMAKSRTSAYQQVLRDEAEIIDRASDAYLYHEHLEAVNQPLYFHEYVERLGRVGLQYLAETDLASMLSDNVSPDLAKLFERTPLVRQEQYLDFITNRMFRCTLACRANVPLVREVTPERLKKLHLGLFRPLEAGEISWTGEDPAEFRLPGGTITAKAPVTKAALTILTDGCPEQLPGPELFQRANDFVAQRGGPREADAARMLADLLRLVARGVLRVAVEPPQFTVAVSPRPQTTPLRRLQAPTGVAANRLHVNVPLKPLGRLVLPLLDGRHDRASLAEAIRNAHLQGLINLRRDGQRMDDPDQATLDRLVDQTLTELSREALLVG